MARPSMRDYCQQQRDCWGEDCMGSNLLCQGNNTDRRNFPQRIAACRQATATRRTMRRTRRGETHGKHNQVGYQVGKNENRHTCENRQAERTLRGHGGSAWRERLPQVQLHGTREETAAASMLDMLYQQGGPRHPERKDC